MIGIIFKKETYQFSRRFLTYLIRFLYILVIFVFIAMIYSGQLQQGGDASALEAKLEKFGTNLYSLLAWAQIVLTIILTPVLVSYAFVSETRDNTLQLIQLTGLTDRSIVLGKVLGKFLAIFLIILTGLPILFFAKIFGFIDFQLIIGNFVNCMCLMLITGGAGAFYGLTNAKFVFAVRKTIITLLIIQCIGGIAAAILLAFSLKIPVGSGQFDIATAFGLATSPLVNQYLLVDTRSSAVGIPNFIFVISIIIELWISFVVFWYFILRAEREYRWWSLGLIAFSGEVFTAKANPVVSAGDPSRALLHSPIDYVATVSPVQKIAESSSINEKWKRMSEIGFPILVGVFWLFFILSLSSQRIGLEEKFNVSAKIALCFFAGLTALWTSISLAYEKENRTLEVLLSTPLRNWKILYISMRNFWVSARWALVITLGSFVLCGFSAKINFLQLLALIFSFSLFLAFYISISLYFSATSESVVKAVVKSSITIAILIIGPPLIMELLFMQNLVEIGVIVGLFSPFEVFNVILLPAGATFSMAGYFVFIPIVVYILATLFLVWRLFTKLRYILE